MLPEDQSVAVREAGTGDIAFNNMIKHYFEGKTKPNSHIALA